MATVDVTVMGAGVFGLSIAWACLQRGARVQVIDPAGVGAGASGGIVGALAPHVPEQWNAKKAFQLDSLLMAGKFWDDVQAAGGKSAGYARKGRLQPLADDAAVDLARKRAETAQVHWGDHATWSVIPATDTAWAPPSPTGLLVFDTLTALLHPAQAMQALAAAFVAKGGTLLTSGAAAGQVAWATGAAGLDDLTQQRGRLVGTGIKGQAAIFDYNAKGQPQLFANGLHIVPHNDGTTAIGSTTERAFDHPTETDAQLDTLIATARAAVPALRDAKVLSRWAGLRPRTRSRAPMLGTHPYRKGDFIANGGFKIGFGMAPKSAKIMADLILDSHDAIPGDFRPEASL